MHATKSFFIPLLVKTPPKKRSEKSALSRSSASPLEPRNASRAARRVHLPHPFLHSSPPSRQLLTLTIVYGIVMIYIYTRSLFLVSSDPSTNFSCFDSLAETSRRRTSTRSSHQRGVLICGVIPVYRQHISGFLHPLSCLRPTAPPQAETRRMQT